MLHRDLRSPSGIDGFAIGPSNLHHDFPFTHSIADELSIGGIRGSWLISYGGRTSRSLS